MSENLHYLQCLKVVRWGLLLLGRKQNTDFGISYQRVFNMTSVQPAKTRWYYGCKQLEPLVWPMISTSQIINSRILKIIVVTTQISTVPSPPTDLKIFEEWILIVSSESFGQQQLANTASLTVAKSCPLQTVIQENKWPDFTPFSSFNIIPEARGQKRPLK